MPFDRSYTTSDWTSKPIFYLSHAVSEIWRDIKIQPTKNWLPWQRSLGDGNKKIGRFLPYIVCGWYKRMFCHNVVHLCTLNCSRYFFSKYLKLRTFIGVSPALLYIKQWSVCDKKEQCALSVQKCDCFVSDNAVNKCLLQAFTPSIFYTEYQRDGSIPDHFRYYETLCN